MKSKLRLFTPLRSVVISTLLFQLTFGCPGQGDLLEALEAVTYDSLEPFESRQDFDDYVDALLDIRGRFYGLGLPFFGCADAAMGEAPRSDTGGDESITNNQEGGVDEGDIVKAAGDFLIILRRGRLFAVRHTVEEHEVLVPIYQVDAFPDGFNRGTWYDELLVHGDRIVVVGFSYDLGATELGLFTLHDDGRIEHDDTFFVRSNDYYSSRNYASRLIDDKLIFYMPYYLIDEWGVLGMRERHTLPAMRRWVQGDEITDWEEILDETDVVRPVQPTSSPTLHTVVQCDLEARELDCSARAVIGPYARSFYVSRDAVYIWVAPGYEPWYQPPAEDDDDDARATSSSSSFVYRLPLGEGEVTALRSYGSPIDQFSFKQGDDGYLNVLLSSDGYGDAMWHPEVASGDLALLRVPLESFGAQPEPAPIEQYRALPAPDQSPMQNRFVGDHLLWGAGGGWWGDGGERRVFVTDYTREHATHQIELAHAVDRIEVLGEGALVAGSDGESLLISALSLDEAPLVVSRLTRPGATQGETRSHGFFFKPDLDGGGVLGLPIRLDGEAYQHLFQGSAEVMFVRVSPGLGLSPLGALAASDAGALEDNCQASCVDWYGNARPIFFRGRVFALLGYELVEGVIDDEAMVELGREVFLR